MEKKMESEIYALVAVLALGLDLVDGQEYTAECRFGYEGPGGWSRWKFAATPELISSATRIFLQ